MDRIEALKQYYILEKHPEGGWFSECYPSKDFSNGRPFGGSIYFLLGSGEISHFHQIDCEEIWYHHEGCGMKITVITQDGISQHLLGSDMDKGENVMVVIPKGAIFAAENLDPAGYTFVSCVTIPQFTYEGFRLVGQQEIKELCPETCEDILYLAYEE